jgi:hypothetical protein
MSPDPVWRLAALHTENADEAMAILFPDGLPVVGSGIDAIEAAITALTESIEDAICRGAEDVTFDVEIAELLALELKRRKRKRGRPEKSPRERLLRAATLRYAESRAEVLRKEGHGVEEARTLAAAEASARAWKAGDHVAPSTVMREMKEAAAAQGKTRKMRT